MARKPSAAQLDAVTGMFGALADGPRLRILMLVVGKERSVSEIATLRREPMTTVSARLQVLHAARLVSRRRQGRSILYSIADEHVLTLIDNAIAHACERH